MAPVGALNGQSLDQNRDQGSTPSLASSCLTRGMAKDWAKTLPSADSATKSGTTLLTKGPSPHTFSKNCAATTTCELLISSLDMAANWDVVSCCTFRGIGGMSSAAYERDVGQHIEHRHNRNSNRRRLPQRLGRVSHLCQDLTPNKSATPPGPSSAPLATHIIRILPPTVSVQHLQQGERVAAGR